MDADNEDLGVDLEGPAFDALTGTIGNSRLEESSSAEALRDDVLRLEESHFVEQLKAREDNG